MSDVVAAQAAHDQAAAALDEAKALCTDECVDEAVHVAHRADVEAAYAEFARTGRALLEAQHG